mmetsp:Transcript_8761/g.10829  ORF Transcript_8761/g.10829 Transcript_8761/m.10829 type:complete len:377 (-) Transcript_8761:18-1148(-)
MGRTLIYKNWSVVCNDGSMWHCFRSVSNKVGWEHIKPFEQKVYSEEGELLFPVQATSGYQIYVVLETQIWTQPGHQGQPRSSLELSEMKKIVETDHVLRKTYFSHSYFRYYEDSEGNLCTADGIIQVLQGKKCRHVSFNTKLTVVLFEDHSVFAYHENRFTNYTFPNVPTDTWFQIDIDPDLNFLSAAPSSGCVYFLSENSLYVWGTGYSVDVSDTNTQGSENLREVTFFAGKNIQKVQASEPCHEILCLCDGHVYTWKDKSNSFRTTDGISCGFETSEGGVSRIKFFENKNVRDIAVPYEDSLPFVLCEDGIYSWNFRQSSKFIREPTKLEVFGVNRIPSWFSANSMRSVCAKRPVSCGDRSEEVNEHPSKRLKN